MKDKSLEVFLILIFGVSGIAVLLLAWLWPVVVPERVPATFIGSFGVFIAVIKALRLKPPKSVTDGGVVVRIGAEDRG